MKNSKILSLLTAGALAVSSFSGLMINSGVALAAASATAGEITPSTGVVLNAGVYQMIKDDTLTLALPTSTSGGHLGGALVSKGDPVDDTITNQTAVDTGVLTALTKGYYEDTAGTAKTVELTASTTAGKGKITWLPADQTDDWADAKYPTSTQATGGTPLTPAAEFDVRPAFASTAATGEAITFTTTKMDGKTAPTYPVEFSLNGDSQEYVFTADVTITAGSYFTDATVVKNNIEYSVLETPSRLKSAATVTVDDVSLDATDRTKATVTYTVKVNPAGLEANDVITLNFTASNTTLATAGKTDANKISFKAVDDEAGGVWDTANLKSVKFSESYGTDKETKNIDVTLAYAKNRTTAPTLTAGDITPVKASDIATSGITLVSSTPTEKGASEYTFTFSVKRSADTVATTKIKVTPTKGASEATGTVTFGEMVDSRPWESGVDFTTNVTIADVNATTPAGDQISRKTDESVDVAITYATAAPTNLTAADFAIGEVKAFDPEWTTTPLDIQYMNYQKNGKKLDNGPVVTISGVSANRDVLTLSLSATNTQNIQAGDYTDVQVYRHSKGFVIAAARITWTPAAAPAGGVDITANMTFVEKGYSNEQSTIAWPKDISTSKTFLFDDTNYLKQTFFGDDVTNAEIEIQYTLTRLTNNDVAASGQNGLSFVGGTTVNGVPTKRETTFAEVAVSGRTVDNWVLRADGAANITVREKNTATGTTALVVYPYEWHEVRYLTTRGDAGIYSTDAFGTGKANTYEVTAGVNTAVSFKGYGASVATFAPAVNAQIEYRLKNTTYFEVAGSPQGFRDRWTSAQLTDAANLIGAQLRDPVGVSLTLTSAAKEAVHNVSTEMYVTVTYRDAAGAYVSSIANTYTLVVAANTDFEIYLVDPNGTAYDDTLAWTIDDIASATKAAKEFYVRSSTVGFDLGTNAGYTTLAYYSITGAGASNYAVQWIDAMGDWNTVANSTVAVPTTRAMRVYMNGNTHQEAKLTVTAVRRADNGSVVWRAVRTYNLTTVVAGITIDTQDTWAVGDVLDLDNDVTVKYNGTEITDKSQLTWTVGDVDNAEINKLGNKLTIKKAGEKFTIAVVYRAAKSNTTARATKEISTVKKLTLAGVNSALTMNVGEIVDLKDALAATKATAVKSLDSAVARVIGTQVKAMSKGETTLRLTDDAGNYTTVALTVVGEAVDPEAGDDVVENGVYAKLNADLESVTVYAADAVNGVITIPATVGGYDVTGIANQAFKGTPAKTIIVEAPVTAIGKGAFKNSKVKNLYFMQADKLTAAGKNSFKGNKTKIFSVGADFSADMVKALKKQSGVKKVKNVESVQ